MEKGWRIKEVEHTLRCNEVMVCGSLYHTYTLKLAYTLLGEREKESKYWLSIYVNINYSNRGLYL